MMGKPASLRLPGRLVIREKRWREFGSFQSRAPLLISQETAGAIAWRFPSQQAPSTRVFTSQMPLVGSLNYMAGGIDWVPPTGLTAGRDGRQEVTHDDADVTGAPDRCWGTGAPMGTQWGTHEFCPGA